jgi:hypothetical protein
MSVKQQFAGRACTNLAYLSGDHSVQKRHSIHVLFLQPAAHDPEEHFLNRVTSYIGKKIHGRGFHHVEIVVPDGTNAGSFYSSSIYNGETVTLTKTKTFANPGYTIMTFSVNGHELDCMLSYLHDSKRQQLHFDRTGMILAALPFQVGWRSSTSTFCSKHVTSALKAGNIEAVMNLNENMVTPSKLFRILQSDMPGERKVVGSVQYKENEMMNHGLFSIS